MSEETDRPISALSKGLAVVEALTQHSRLSDIAGATGLPLSTVHRVLAELLTTGWAYQGPDRNYSPGGRLLALSRAVFESGDYRTLADPILRRLVDETGHTMHFGIVDGTRATYVSKVDGHRAYRMRSRVGLTIALHSTAIGKAYLASLPETDRVRIVQALDLPKITERTLTDAAELLRHLRQGHARGWSLDNQENEAATRCVGAAVLDSSGRPIGGVSLSSLTFDFPMHEVTRLAPRVCEIAAELTATLAGAAP